MMKILSSISRPDYTKLCVLITLNAILCCAGIGVLFLREGLDNLLSPFIPLDAPRGEAVELVLQLILIAIFAVPAGVLINKLRVWLISLPIQVVLNFAIIKLIYGDSIVVIAKINAYLLMAQCLGVAIGLLIRYLISKVKARKQPVQAE